MREEHVRFGMVGGGMPSGLFLPSPHYILLTTLNSLTISQPPLLAQTRHMKVWFPSIMG